MPVYPCPDCGTKLKPAKPVPAGKKIRCPECGNVFAPTAAAATPAKPAAATAPAKPADDDEVESYGVVHDEEDAAAEERRRQVFDPIKDRFKRSKRGPALIHVVRPSDWLLRVGIATCIAAIAGALWSIWPMVFKIEMVNKPDEKGKFVKYSEKDASGRRFKELTPEEVRERWLFLGGFVFQFAWGAAVCGGASKMHTLDSYPLAMIGSVMGLAGPGVPLGIFLLQDALKDSDPSMMACSVLLMTVPGVPVSLWCLKTLRNKEVIEGFAEEKPED